jgi:co-chaperonin GroES (HSP10)
LTTTAMMHPVDPKRALLDRIGDVSHIQLMNNQVLVATYIRPERTKGNIILPLEAQKEDKYQGKVGLVIAKGPLAFVDDGNVRFGGQDVAIGDWAAYRMSDGWQFTIKGRSSPDNPLGEHHCRMLQDVDIKAIVSHPDDLI